MLFLIIIHQYQRQIPCRVERWGWQCCSISTVCLCGHTRKRAPTIQRRSHHVLLARQRAQVCMHVRVVCAWV